MLVMNQLKQATKSMVKSHFPVKEFDPRLPPFAQNKFATGMLMKWRHRPQAQRQSAKKGGLRLGFSNEDRAGVHGTATRFTFVDNEFVID